MRSLSFLDRFFSRRRSVDESSERDGERDRGRERLRDAEARFSDADGLCQFLFPAERCKGNLLCLEVAAGAWTLR